MTPTHLLTLDLGSTYLRAAQTPLHPADGIPKPQLVEFRGQRALRNIVCLKPDGMEIQDQGQDVLEEGLAEEFPARIRQGATPDAPPESDLGRVVTLLLASLYKTVGFDKEGERATYQTILAAPSPFHPQVAALYEQYLKATNFPHPQLLDPALAALTWVTRHQDKPGRYLVIDGGASTTRVALCELTSRLERATLLHATAGKPGGRDFDRALESLFRRRYPTLAPDSPTLELLYFLETFKEEFSRCWGQGKNEHRTPCPYWMPSQTFALSVEEFQQPEVAGSLIRHFASTVDAALQESRCTRDQLQGVVLIGGGAHWPFAKTWVAETFGQERLLVPTYPEESVVQGLALFATLKAPVKEPFQPPVRPPVRPPIRPDPPTVTPTPPTRTPVSPLLTALLEGVGGTVGFLGLGWLVMLGNMPVGCSVMVGWWFVLALGFVGLSGFAISQEAGGTLLLCLPLWFVGPVLSAWMAARKAQAINQQQLPKPDR